MSRQRCLRISSWPRPGERFAVKPYLAGDDVAVVREQIEERHRHGGLATAGLTDKAQRLAALHD